MSDLIFEEDIFDVSKKENIFKRLDLEMERMEDISDFMSLVEPIGTCDALDVQKGYKYFPNMSDDELFGLVHDFYRDATDKDIFKKFIGVFRKRGKYLNMTRLM